jgi:hypothetical protein
MKLFAQIMMIFSLVVSSATLSAAPDKKYSNQWVAYDPLSTKKIKYPAWKQFLNNYTLKKNGQVYVQYHQVTQKHQKRLKQGIERLTDISINRYNRQQQLAYWINLYNMETIHQVLKHYPVDSIKDINKGYFSSGPWDKKVVKVNEHKLTLNEIEHGIIRPVWNDPRIHAAVNCASMSCPNLLQTPYRGSKINKQLNNAFDRFVNSKKGVKFDKNDIYLSKIFEWYGQDFGPNTHDMKRFISYYLDSKHKSEKLLKSASIQYMNYDWSLNERKQ